MQFLVSSINLRALLTPYKLKRMAYILLERGSQLDGAYILLERGSELDGLQCLTMSIRTHAAPCINLIFTFIWIPVTLDKSNDCMFFLYHFHTFLNPQPQTLNQFKSKL